MVLGVVISFAFASELLRFGTGMMAVVGGTLALVGIVVWLFTTNVLAWRGQALPRNLALLGMATAITVTLSLSRLGTMARSNPEAWSRG